MTLPLPLCSNCNKANRQACSAQQRDHQCPWRCLEGTVWRRSQTFIKESNLFVKISALTFGEKWWELVQITHIDLSHNSICPPPRISFLIANFILYISEIPERQFNEDFPELKSLDIAYNQISSIPPSLFIEPLLRINLAFNKLIDIPETVS